MNITRPRKNANVAIIQAIAGNMTWVGWLLFVVITLLMIGGNIVDNIIIAKHMRDKYEYFRRDIVTAEDFIRLCGTRSELTLQPYRVRKQDGSEQLTADLLGAELRALRLKAR